MFNEKIYVFMWLWCFGLFIITVLNILSWLWQIYMPYSRIEFVRKYLRIAKASENADHLDKNYMKRDLDDFVRNYLRVLLFYVCKYS